VIELPFAPPGVPRRVEGRDAITAFFERSAGVFQSIAFCDIEVEQLADPTRAVARFRSEGVMASTGRSYINNYISIATVKADKLILYREYFDPMVAIEASRT
jgi:ketosteroid isomerase-like protein